MQVPFNHALALEAVQLQADIQRYLGYDVEASANWLALAAYSGLEGPYDAEDGDLKERGAKLFKSLFRADELEGLNTAGAAAGSAALLRAMHAWDTRGRDRPALSGMPRHWRCLRPLCIHCPPFSVGLRRCSGHLRHEVGLLICLACSPEFQAMKPSIVRHLLLASVPWIACWQGFFMKCARPVYNHQVPHLPVTATHPSHSCLLLRSHRLSHLLKHWVLFSLLHAAGACHRREFMHGGQAVSAS